MKKILYFALCFVLAMSITISSGAQIISAKNVENALEVQARGAILIDADSGTVLFSENENNRHPIASMTKIMTLLLTFEAVDNGVIDLHGETYVSENASSMGGSQVFLDGNTKYKTSDLIKSVVVASANDASVALAEQISGSEENFVVKMNEKAKQLGLTNTNFANATGLPAPSAYSCASDVAKMFRHLIAHKDFFNYSTIYLDTLTHPSGRETQLANTNKLIKFYDGCDAGKTGSTSEAKFCLCASAKRNNMRLIACVIGCENSKIRNAQVSNLFNFGFANFKSINVVSKLQEFEAPVLNAEQKFVIAMPKTSFNQVISNSSNKKIEIQEVFFENLKAPIKKGDKVGELLVTKDNEIIKKVDLIAKEDVLKISFKTSLKNLLKDWNL